MKPLILGSGAREHAIARKFAESKRISGLYIAPGNAGTAELGENIADLDPFDGDSIIEHIKEKKINVVFVGPEAPLAAGIVDRLAEENIKTIGPKRSVARLESSKVFSKQFMIKYNIPTARTVEFHDTASFEEYIKRNNGKMVLKKSGLASGKGVFESEDKDALIEFGDNVLADDALLVEEFLEGYEITIFAATDGRHYLLFPPCADFKKEYDGDTGRNTGGMGSICPVPGVTRSLQARLSREIVEPTFEALHKEGLAFKGFLYFGIIVTETGPKVLEYNVRLGDPETQVLLPLIESDFGNLLDAILKTELDTFPLRISDRSAVGIVVASKGYPGTYTKDIPVTSLPKDKENELFVFHSSTHKHNNKDLLTGGGRCFTVVGIADDFLEAQMKAYREVQKVSFKGSWYRKDIGNRFLY